VQVKDQSQFIIIDDRDLIVSLVIRMLKNNGYKQFVTANSAAAALTILKKNPVNFIITDWEMPDMTGIELLIHIRKKLRLFDMPILMMSENMTENKILYAVEEGVDGYIDKPFSENVFIKTVNQIFQSKLNPDPMKYQLQKLHSLRLQKKYDSAITLANSLLKEQENMNVLVVLGECYLSCKRYKAAKSIFLKALEIKKTYKALHLLGKVYMAEGNCHKAIEFLEEAYFINPMNTDAVIDMGNAYLRLGFTKEATKAFGALEDDKLTDLNYTNIASAYLGSGDIDKAGKYIEQTQNPILETINVFNRYAIELRKTGRFQESIDQYKRCLKIDPENYIILSNAAVSYIKIENYSEAEKLLEKSFKINPDSKTVEKLLDYVRSKVKG